jgi:hypothetical protein
MALHDLDSIMYKYAWKLELHDKFWWKFCTLNFILTASVKWFVEFMEMLIYGLRALDVIIYQYASKLESSNDFG